MANFSDSRSILNKKPRIFFVEPEQIPEDQGVPVITKVDPSVKFEEAKNKTQAVIDQYNRIEKLSEVAQKRIDERAKDVRICLDPVIDADIIVSLRRKFKVTDNCITYAQYKHCLEELSKAGQEVAPMMTAEDIQSEKSNPFKKNFGGFGRPDGQLRQELNIPSPVKAVDLGSFQSQSIAKLFEIMFPMLSGLVDAKIVEHRLTTPHNG